MGNKSSKSIVQNDGKETENNQDTMVTNKNGTTANANTSNKNNTNNMGAPANNNLTGNQGGTQPKSAPHKEKRRKVGNTPKARKRKNPNDEEMQINEEKDQKSSNSKKKRILQKSRSRMSMPSWMRKQLKSRKKFLSQSPGEQG